HQAGCGIGGVTLRCNPLVPVMIRIGRILELNFFYPRILSGGLIEVAMNADVLFHLLALYGRIAEDLTLKT
ncbi:MAG: hypothetical protein ACXU99_12910, partial [Thermodesulfobacteriota bacterium]